MLPIGRGQGSLWNGDRHLCKVDYDISPPLEFITIADAQRVHLVVHDYECTLLLNIAGLTLVLANGTRHRLPRPLKLSKTGHMECFLTADA